MKQSIIVFLILLITVTYRIYTMKQRETFQSNYLMPCWKFWTKHTCLIITIPDDNIISLTELRKKITNGQLVNETVTSAAGYKGIIINRDYKDKNLLEIHLVFDTDLINKETKRRMNNLFAPFPWVAFVDVASLIKTETLDITKITSEKVDKIFTDKFVDIKTIDVFLYDTGIRPNLVAKNPEHHLWFGENKDHTSEGDSQYQLDCKLTGYDDDDDSVDKNTVCDPFASNVVEAYAFYVKPASRDGIFNSRADAVYNAKKTCDKDKDCEGF